MDAAGRRRAGRRIAAAAGERGWSLRELSRQAGVDSGTVGAIVAGSRWPQARTRSRLEDVLDWPAGEIARLASGDPAHDPNRPHIQPLDPDLVTALSRADEPTIAAVWAVLRAVGRTRRD